MKKISFLFCNIIILLFLGCETVIEVDLPEYKPKIVIDGFFSTETFWQIRVTNSVGILDIKSSESITNATVKILADSEEYELELTNSFSGIYSLDGRYPEAGKEYTLNVSAPGFTNVISSNFIPAPSQIISIDKSYYFEDYGGGFREQNIELNITLKDDPAVDNYYHLAIYDKQNFGGNEYYNSLWFTSENLAIISENEGDGDGISFSGNSAVFNDYLFSGEEYKIKVKEIYDYGISNIVVELTSITKDFFLFEKSANSSLDDGAGVFSEPESQYTNVENGLGIFAGFNTTYFEVK